MVISGHPTGNPNSHNAALAWHEHGELYKFCTPWFPSKRELALIRCIPGLKEQANRLGRRRCEQLADARMRQGKVAEIVRIVRAQLGWTGPDFTKDANKWLMSAMASECVSPHVRAVHCFEDCSLLQFREAKRRGKACIYDMPTCHWKFWQNQHQQLCNRYGSWIRPAEAGLILNADPEQKDEELRLADAVLAPSTFVKRTLEDAGAKAVRLCRYGVDLEFWSSADGEELKRRRDEETKRPRDEETAERSETGRLGDQIAKRDQIRFIYAGQCSLRKGIPFLLETWEKAQLRDAELVLVGSWQLAADRLQKLPAGVRFVGPVGSEKLRELYRQSDVFLFPSFADGFGLVMLEALAAGLRVIASDTSGGPDIADLAGVTVLPSGAEDAWVAALRSCVPWHDRPPAGLEDQGWARYRRDAYEATREMV